MNNIGPKLPLSPQMHLHCQSHPNKVGLEQRTASYHKNFILHNDMESRSDLHLKNFLFVITKLH